MDQGLISVSQWSASYIGQNYLYPDSFISELRLGDEHFTKDNKDAIQSFS